MHPARFVLFTDSQAPPGSLLPGPGAQHLLRSLHRAGPDPGQGRSRSQRDLTLGQTFPMRGTAKKALNTVRCTGRRVAVEGGTGGLGLGAAVSGWAGEPGEGSVQRAVMAA